MDIQRAVEARLCKNSYYEFFKLAWHIIEPNRPLVDNWHIKYLCDVAEDEVRRIAAGEPKEHDYIINIPFRALKSQIFAVMLQPWAWIEFPWLRFTTVSYSAGLALNHSNKSQKIMSSDWYKRRFGSSFKLKSDVPGATKLKETETYYENDQGGFRFVSSVTGGSTGYGGDINIADDLLKAQESDSEAARKKANHFWGDTYPSRVSDFDKTVFFLIHQRLHDNDPTGYSLQAMEEGDAEKFYHINIPAEDIGNIKPRGLRAFYRDGLFFPERFSRKVIEDFKKPTGIGLRSANAQLNQKPQKPGGNLFQEQWFVKVPRRKMPRRKHFDRIYRYWDTAYTEDEKNSACAFVEMGIIKGQVYILNYGYKWVEFPDQIEWMSNSPPDLLHKIEAKASGKSAAQTLRRNNINAAEIEIEGGDKRARGNSISLHLEGGRVSIPEYHWEGFLNDARQGILKFPDGTHTDLGDAFVIGITDLLGVPEYDPEDLDKIIEQEPAHVF